MTFRVPFLSRACGAAVLLFVAAVDCRAAEVAAPTASASAASTANPADAASWLVYGQDFTSNCVTRQGVEINVRNTHPSRTVRVWFDRYHMGTGTGDRSRTDLRPGADPDPLGCSRSEYGVQEWRLVKAQFVD